MSPHSDQTMAMELTAGPVVGPVIRRVVGMLAARADMRVDRVDDVILLAEALGIAAAEHCAGGKLGVRVADGDTGLHVEFGPLDAGSGKEAVSKANESPTPGTASADQATVRAGRGGDYIELNISDGDR
jgi:hypothetical protein